MDIIEIEDNALYELKERLEEIAEVESGEVTFYQLDEWDVFHEIADSNVPIYTGDIIELACNHNFLATNEPELGPAFDGSPTPVNIIAANIYEYIQEFLFLKLETIKDKIADEMLELNCIVCGKSTKDDSLLGDETDEGITCLECYENE